MFKKISTFYSLLLLAVALIAPNAKADEWNKKTIVTVNEPLLIPGAMLQPGKYVFKLADSLSNRHIVQVFNEDESHVLATILANSNDRLEPANGTVLELWETPKGSPRALRAWFYPGDTIGQEFRYPKDEADKLTAEVHKEVPALSDEDQAALSKFGSQSASSEKQASSEQPAPPAADQSREQPRVDSSESSSAVQPEADKMKPETESAQTSSATESQAQPQLQNPAPESPTVSSDSAATGTTADNSMKADSTKRELPKTGSYLPLIGLSGLLSLAAAAIARAR